MTTLNRSLAISCRIKEMMRQDTLQFIAPVFPGKAVQEYESATAGKRRDRVYTSENTLMTMVVTALHPDRSLQNSVRIFQEVFKRHRESVLAMALKEQRALKVAIAESGKRKRGRPRTGKVRIPISKIKDVSSNTAAFSKARDRVDVALIEQAYKDSADFSTLDGISRWHGRLVYNTDGTYLQMQDTKEIPDKYRVQRTSAGVMQGYPQGLLQVLTQHGSGLLAAYRIAGRTESELDVLAKMIPQLPRDSLLLADDLYNCYAMFYLLMQHGIDIIVPDKKQRTYRVIKTLADGDEIVEIPKPTHPRPLVKGQQLPPTLTLRRVTYCDPNNPEKQWVLLTTILDASIEKTDIVCRYTSRWDIEISIREIKTLMGINIVRAKSEEMTFREIGVALLAYNLVRRIIAQSAAETPFSPETDIFEKLYSSHTTTLVDRKGRVYCRWSPGRPPAHPDETQRTLDSMQTWQTLPSKN